MTRRLLDGRVAVITGGAQGVGFAVGERMLAEGATVVLGDLHDGVSDAAARLGAGASGVMLDVTDRGGIESTFAEIVARHGSIDVLVNAAGASAPHGPAWELSQDHWDRMLRVNLTGVFSSCAAVIPYMRERQYGRIVNVSSIAGKEGNPNSAAYSASKAGVIGLTKSLGKELATSGVLVNAVAPSAIDTAMFAALPESSRTYILSKIPMGRPGRPAELAALIAWLSSEECSYSTGFVFDFSGGRATS